MYRPFTFDFWIVLKMKRNIVINSNCHDAISLDAPISTESPITKETFITEKTKKNSFYPILWSDIT